ncbi:DUF1801 domain-containing protein [Paenibacillus tarimensis]|uniref:DUF1801 domain-containing protein n=1 Tax=Paenibacillus tarimensis TaxID=416012 RepID=UPI001F1FAE5C|nr:DUF1801 domain-containing protein [Paenibacillus tarimensis]MCF2941992.1 DUF1801 domain-containing protein [Paenibacillus tarimensis]
MTQDVVNFIDALPEPWQVQLCHQLRDVVHQVIPGVQERIQYKKPHFLKNGKYAAVISVSKDAVSFTLFNAASLELPQGSFEGPPERKTIKLRQSHTADMEQLSSWLGYTATSL